ncbi:MAG: hypothetical protein ACFBSF_10070 [Leptolyngbyaceae cyanobacterium]
MGQKDVRLLTAPSTFVVDGNTPFLGLWPHRFDFIWAEHSEARNKPQWHTESRYPLSDRLILQGSYLYGVRFDSTTSYIMLDIDRGSLYHPSHDSLAIPRMQAALEDLGLVSSLICTSSYSGGLHLYFPFIEAQKTWEIALAVATLLENQGFKQAAGHLELYPNPRNFAAQGEPTLYHAHRLPLQLGSYILDEDYTPISASRELFVQRWYQCQFKNDLDAAMLKRVLKIARRRSYRVTTKAEKFLNDLNAEIELGWTGPGMTNRLLGRITMRSYIFGHILYAKQPLTGDALVQDIVQTARNLPGFYEWSNHVHEIEKRAQDWARAIERTERYFPYGAGKGINSVDVDGISPPSYHDQLATTAREKVRLAIVTLLEEGTLPVTVSARFKLLTGRFHIGGSTLYKHKDLWHPDHLMDAAPVENPPAPPTFRETSEVGRYEGSPTSESPSSLLEAKPGNSTPALAFEESLPVHREPGLCNDIAAEADGQLCFLSVKAAIATARTNRQRMQAERQASQAEHRRRQAEAAQKAYAERMEQYLASGDPILMGEALDWLQRLQR